MPGFKQTVVHTPVTAETWIWSHASLCETGGGKKWQWGRFLTECFSFSLSVSFHQCCILMATLILTFVGLCIVNVFLSITNKMQQYSLLLSMLYMFQAVSLPIIRSSKTVHTALGICRASGSSKQARHIPDAVCTVFELLMMGGETAWNM